MGSFNGVAPGECEGSARRLEVSANRKEVRRQAVKLQWWNFCVFGLWLG